MPYKSLAQAAYFNIHRKELERQGVDVDEWNDSSRGKKLPKKVKKAGLLDVDLLLKTAAEATFVHGIHGDEPAGTLALKEKGEDSVDAGNHTGDRKINGNDLNRHIGKDSPILKAVLKKNPKLVVDLHEDNDASGVYAYTSPSQKEKVKKILSSIGGLSVASKGNGEKTDGGVISAADGPYSGSLERAVAKKKIPYITLETPGKKPLEDRVDYQKKFIDKIKKGEVDFKPDYTPEQLKEMGVYREVYGKKDGPRLASLEAWPAHWYHPEDKKGWLEWYQKYSAGRRMEDDTRQINRWKAFKARHGGPAFQNNPTPRRAFALRNWGIDASKLVKDPDTLQKVMEAYRAKQYNR